MERTGRAPKHLKITDKQIDAIKVNELREKLKKVNLSTAGKKNELRERKTVPVAKTVLVGKFVTVIKVIKADEAMTVEIILGQEFLASADVSIHRGKIVIGKATPMDGTEREEEKGTAVREVRGNGDEAALTLSELASINCAEPK
ncbi:hypothetical protein KM043_018218 [Ampulex compressa]|nr:hypothetical protein KM043_018218 [Ampulex compressa]